jgi:endogenous inhibitor of DNA gyrase (YacG/DUF329 family)
MFCLLPDNSMYISTLQSAMMHQKLSVNVTRERKSFPCKFCDKTFAWKNSLQAHVSNIHGESRGPFPCPLCGKMSKNKKSLKAHLHDFHRRWSTWTEEEPNVGCVRDHYRLDDSCILKVHITASKHLCKCCFSLLEISICSILCISKGRKYYNLLLKSVLFADDY